MSGTTLNSTITGSSLTSVGTITSGTWSGTAISVANGGTGVTTLTGLVKGNGTSAFTSAISGTDYQAPITLTTTGTGAATLSGTTLNIPTPATGSSNTHSIGEVYGGGIVFYVWDGGAHGLIASVADLPYSYSGNTGAAPGSSSSNYKSWNTVNSDGILSGKKNTERIILAQSLSSGAVTIVNSNISSAMAAANYVNPKIYLTYTFEEYGDWYLPSSKEMHLLALSRNNSGITLASTYYATSTETTYSLGNTYNVENVSSGTSTTDDGYKIDPRKVRPIRSF